MSDFTTTHVVPGGGLGTWAVPDSSSPPGPRLDPTLPVQLVEQQGPWARVICSNGWGAWVEGRLLLPVAGGAPSGPPHVAPAGPPAAGPDAWGAAVPAVTWDGAPQGPVTTAYPAAPAAPGTYPAAPAAFPAAPAAYPPVTGGYAPVAGTVARGRPFGRIVPALAGAAVFVSAFLPWLSRSGVSRSGLHTPAAFLFNDTTSANAGFAVGHLLWIAGAVTLLGALIPSGAWLARLGGAVAAAIGILFVVQLQRLFSSLGEGGAFSFIGAGVYVAIICGLLALVTTRRARRAPPRAGPPPLPPQPG